MQSFVDFGGLLQCGGGGKTRRQPNMDQRQQARANSNVLLVLRYKRRGSEVQAHTYKKNKVTTNVQEKIKICLLTSNLYLHE